MAVAGTDPDEIHTLLVERVTTRLLDLPVSHTTMTMPLERMPR